MSRWTAPRKTSKRTEILDRALLRVAETRGCGKYGYRCKKDGAEGTKSASKVCQQNEVRVRTRKLPFGSPSGHSWNVPKTSGEGFGEKKKNKRRVAKVSCLWSILLAGQGKVAGVCRDEGQSNSQLVLPTRGRKVTLHICSSGRSIWWKHSAVC